MKLNSLITYHIKKILEIESTYGAIRYLSKHFNKIGSGCESEVFSREGFEYVIKIQHCPFERTGTDYDHPSDKHFVPTIVFRGENFNIIIQPKCKFVIARKYNKYRINYAKFEKFVRKAFNISDTHDGNMGFYNGRIMVFDWTMDVEHC